jgi:HEPN domain-containing protein
MVEPFLWSALQATEKYLKAILLYNGVSTIGVKHDLARLRLRPTSLEMAPVDRTESLDSGYNRLGGGRTRGPNVNRGQ